MRVGILCFLLSMVLMAQKPPRPDWPPSEPPAQPPLVTPPSLPPIEPIDANGPWIVTIVEKGVYMADTSYNLNDVVRYKGDDYVSMAALNQNNEPNPASSLWLMLPKFHNPTQAGWGSGEGVVKIKGKHFKSASSYVCEATSELLSPPPEGEGRAGPGAKPESKTKFTYQSGSQFTIASPASTQTHYICAGEGN